MKEPMKSKQIASLLKAAHLSAKEFELNLRRLSQVAAKFPSAKEFELALIKLGRAAAEAPIPDHAVIRRIRLLRIKRDYGFLRFITPEYYHWLLWR